MCNVSFENPLYILVARIKGSKEFAAAAAQILREDYMVPSAPGRKNKTADEPAEEFLLAESGAHDA